MKMKSTAVTVKAGSTFELPILISKPGTIVHWVFHIKYYDIHFGIAKGKEGKDRKFIVANTSYLADSPQEGKLVFPEVGDYYLVFDNTYSWVREKNVVYSIDIVLPELTIEEKVECARTIISDLEKMNHEIADYEAKKAEKKQHLLDLEKLREEKQAELEQEILSVEEKMKVCDANLIELQEKVGREENSISTLAVTAPFLLEGNRIISMLTGPDLLRLSCVSRLMHDAVSRDSVWVRVFKQDNKENLAIVLRNEWVLKKWNLLNPDVPVPVEVSPIAVQQTSA